MRLPPPTSTAHALAESAEILALGERPWPVRWLLIAAAIIFASMLDWR